MVGKYEILFVGLKPGKHIFTYEIDNQFFQGFENSMIQKCDVFVHLTFEKKKETFFVLDFFIDGIVQTDCDRCLADINLQVNNHYQLIIKVKHLEEQNNDDPNVIYLEENQNSFNVKQLLFEYINLSFPIRKVCEDDIMETKTCNKEVMSLLEKEREEPEEEIDPRWDLLKNLKSE
jgi:DUF177 domain-containing protein